MIHAPRTLLTAALLLSACGDADEPGEPIDPRPYASAITSFEPGEGAGFGQDRLPQIVLGPPGAGGSTNASLDVLSLGRGGQIVLDLAPREVIDGPGPDLIVFENPFWIGGDPTMVWAELGEVSLSEDGQTWHTFSCAQEPTSPGRWPGCAGWTPTLTRDAEATALDPAVTGGDTFDLAELGIQRARFVRIRDVSTTDPTGPSAGFDLDAVGLIHHELVR
jgi:hypothetical protein